MARRIKLLQQEAHLVVEILRRRGLVARAPENQRRVVAEPENGVADVREVEVGVDGIDGVELPQVLPEHDSVLVAGVRELVALAHPAPVADHVEVLFAVKPHLMVDALPAHALEHLVESPVAALHEHANAVDGKRELRLVAGEVLELPDAEPELLPVARSACRHKRNLHVVEIRLSESVRPP